MRTRLMTIELVFILIIFSLVINYQTICVILNAYKVIMKRQL